MNKLSEGVIKIAVTSVIRGISQGLFPKIISANPVLISAVRIIVPVIFIYLWRLFSGNRITGVFARHNWVFHFLSIFVTIRLVLFLSGYYFAPISVATVIFFASTVYITALEPLILKVPFSLRNFFLSIICFVALCFMVFSREIEINFSDTEFLGYSLMFIASIMVVFESFFKKKLVNRLSSFEWPFYLGLAGSLLLLPVLFIFPVPTLNDFLLMIVFGVLVGIFAFALDMSALKSLRLSSHRILSYMEPLVAILTGVIIFHEVVTTELVVAMVVVFGTVWFTKKE